MPSLNAAILTGRGFPMRTDPVGEVGSVPGGRHRERIKIYAQRRWAWWRIAVPWVLGVLLFAFLLFGAWAGYRDPDVGRIYRNDTYVRVQAVVFAAVMVPYLLALQLLVTLQAIGRWPVLVLYETSGVRHVASWLGSRRLSKYRLAITGKATMRVFTINSDVFKRQLIEFKVGKRRIRVQSYGDISDADLEKVRAWVEGARRSAST